MATRTMVRLSLSWKSGDIDFSKMHISLQKSDRWSWLELETTRRTQQSFYNCAVLGMTKTSVNETEEARALQRAARFIFAEADTEWYAEQIAHSISGDASELEVTWSFDPVEAIWWCGVLDPSIPSCT